MRKVVPSRELTRVLNLPRRELFIGEPERPPEYCKKDGEFALLPIQVAALREAQEAKGLFANICVGGGKTLIGLLLPVALEAKRPLLLVPPSLKKQILRERDTFYSKHFKMHSGLTIMAYSELSNKKNTTFLEELQPDLVVADEGHCLSRTQSVRTRRFLRYFRQHPDTMFCVMSGTMTRKSIIDYAHLLRLALRENAPIPLSWHELQDWAGALDVKPMEPLLPGALEKLGGGSVREGYRDRLVQTSGVVATEEGELGTSLIIHLSPKCVVPEPVAKYVKTLKQTWTVGAEEITEAKDLARVLSQLYSGFYYRWDWPEGKPDKDWMEARAAWKGALRNYLRYRSVPERDSNALVTEQVQLGNIPEMFQVYEDYQEQRLKRSNNFGQEQPPKVPVWIDRYLVDVADKWIKKNKGIVWYQHECLEPLLAELMPVYGSGTDAGEATEETIACSIGSQGTGKNLQFKFCDSLFLNFPPGGAMAEQVLGRTHRKGQDADEVNAFVVDIPSNRKALDTARKDAVYQQDTLRQKQRLLYASFV